MFSRNCIVLFCTVLLASCANTSVVDSWQQTEHSRQYKRPMVIGVSDSQQTRQLYEKHFVAGLKQRNITAIPSYTLISSKQKINRKTIVDAVQGTNIDSVLVTYLVSADSEMKHHDSPINTGYSGSAEYNQMSATIVSNRGQSRNEEVFVLKNDLYDVRSQVLVWSVQTKTVGPESVDEVIEDVTMLLIEKMFDDALLK